MKAADASVRQGWEVAGILLISFILIHARPALACSKVQSVSGNSCETLNVQLDISKCQDHAVGAPRIECSDDAATATLEGEKYSYVARLKKTEGQWGRIAWVAQGEVAETAIEGSKKSEVTKSKKKKGAASDLVKTKVPKAHQRQEEAQAVSATVSVPVTPPAASAATSTQPTATATPVAPASATTVTPFGITFAGYLDGYFVQNFNHPQPVTVPASTPPTYPIGNVNNRLYDIYSNQVTLNLAEFTIRKAGQEVSVLVDLDFGTQADLNASLAPGVSDVVSKYIGQAVLTYTPAKVSGLTIDFGKMYTHVGYETAKARDNWQYSRSDLYSYGIPIWHTGVHVGYELLPKKVTIGGYLYNGWNSIYDNNSGKTLGAQLKFTPNDSLILVYNYIGGPEQAKNDSNRKTLHEVNEAYSMNPVLSFAADQLYGTEDNAVSTGNAFWWAATLAMKAQLTARYSISPRAEVYRDGTGYTLSSGGQQTITDYTLTNAFVVADGFETRLEARYDHSTSSTAFTTTDGTSKSQVTLAAALMYTF
jgi:hypothetical protein